MLYSFGFHDLTMVYLVTSNFRSLYRSGSLTTVVGELARYKLN